MTSEEKSVTQDPQDERKVTWGYTRKTNLGNYESEEVSVYVTDHVPKSTKNVAKWVGDKSEAMFDTLKTQVWDGLGLEFEYDELGHPKLTAPVPPPAPVPVSPAPQPVPAQQATRGGRRDDPSIAQIGYYADPPDFCDKCGQRDFYDNRTDVDARITAGQKIGPDFKCKNCNNGVWRPGSYDYNKHVGGGGGGATPSKPPAF